MPNRSAAEFKGVAKFDYLKSTPVMTRSSEDTGFRQPPTPRSNIWTDEG